MSGDWSPPDGYEGRRQEMLAEEADDERDGGVSIQRPPINPTLAQLEVLIAIAELGSNKAVAHRFGVSEQTVKNHLTSILWRIQAKNRSHAVLLMWPVLIDAFPLFEKPGPGRTGWVRRKADRITY